MVFCCLCAQRLSAVHIWILVVSYMEPGLDLRRADSHSLNLLLFLLRRLSKALSSILRRHRVYVNSRALLKTRPNRQFRINLDVPMVKLIRISRGRDVKSIIVRRIIQQTVQTAQADSKRSG